MGSMSIVHWMIVVGVVVLLFGRGKISGLMGDVAQGMKSFKKGLQDDEPVEPPSRTEAADERPAVVREIETTEAPVRNMSIAEREDSKNRNSV